MLESIAPILPVQLRHILGNLPTAFVEQLEELRIREGRPLEAIARDRFGFIDVEGHVLDDPQGAYRPSKQEFMQLIDLLTNHSLYALEEELKKGYITVRGGHRVGIAGKTILEAGKVRQIRDISSVNIRLAKEVIGCGIPFLPYLMDHESRNVHHTFVLSAPQQGKTTLIRDLARMISYGQWPEPVNWTGKKVGIVDERSEIAASYQGVPVFDVGPRTDVLDGCPKAEGMMMFIRSMSPEVLVVDEIGNNQDAESLQEAIRSGIRVIATAHCNSFQEARSRPVLRDLLDAGIFTRYILLGNKYVLGSFPQIYDGQGKLIEAPRIQRGSTTA